MKVIFKNSELQFAKAKIISTSFQVDFTSGTKANGKITLPNIQDVGTYFKVQISGDTDKFPENSLFLSIGGGQRRDLPLVNGDNTLISDCFADGIGVMSSANATSSGSLYVTVDYAENNIEFDEMLSKMTQIGDVTSEKPSGTPPASIGPFNLDSSLPADHWYQLAYVIDNDPGFQFVLQLLNSDEEALVGSTIRSTDENLIASASVTKIVSKCKVNQPLGNDASDIHFEIYAYDIKSIHN